MLFIIVVLLFSGACTATKDEEDFTNEFIECEKKARITPHDVEVTFKNGLDGANENFKYFIACLIEDSYKFTEDGGFDAETTIANARGSLKDKNTIEALRACSDINGYNEYDAIFNVYQCVVENVQKLNSHNNHYKL